MFEKFVSPGESILSYKVQQDKEGKLLDYGYITFSNYKDAQAAQDNLNKTEIGENQVLLI